MRDIDARAHIHTHTYHTHVHKHKQKHKQKHKHVANVVDPGALFLDSLNALSTRQWVAIMSADNVQEILLGIGMALTAESIESGLINPRMVNTRTQIHSFYITDRFPLDLYTRDEFITSNINFPKTREHKHTLQKNERTQTIIIKTKYSKYVIFCV